MKTQAKVTIPDKYQDAENVQFAFVYQGKSGSSLWIDNINLYVEDPSMVHTITATASEGGIIDPSGSVTVMDGKSRTFTIMPEDKHYVADVKVDGVSVGTPSTYTFTMPASDVTVKATFAKDSSSSFSDVAEGDYFYDAVKWAVENGITKGTGKTTFSVNADCTRGQIVTLLCRAYQDN